jgi:FkbM family methyltransferase
MKQFIKQRLKNGFPDIITAYHFYRDQKVHKDMHFRKSVFGFDLMAMEAMQDGTFEPEETKVLSDNLQRADVFIDIGANVGYFSCIARNKGVKTVAVEPLPENLKILYANLKINGWDDVEIFPVGLAERPGIAEMYGGGTGASLLSGWAGASDLWKRTISLTTLDTIIGKRFIGKRLLIKMDVEGAEYGVLKGAQSTIKTDPKPTWLMEVCLTENQPQGLNPDFLNIFELFWDNGYQANSVGEASRIVTPDDVQRWLNNRTRDFGYVNYLFSERQ